MCRIFDFLYGGSPPSRKASDGRSNVIHSFHSYLRKSSRTFLFSTSKFTKGSPNIVFRTFMPHEFPECFLACLSVHVFYQCRDQAVRIVVRKPGTAHHGVRASAFIFKYGESELSCRGKPILTCYVVETLPQILSSNFIFMHTPSQELSRERRRTHSPSESAL